MSRTCESCGRSWRGSATFCGACGDLLPDALSATVVRAPGQDGTPRRGVLAVSLGIAVLAGAAAVPTLAIERTPPVTGEIGVPGSDDLRAAPSSASRRRQVPAPETTCTRDGAPVDCVVWSRDLLGPPDRNGDQGWPVVAADHVLLAGPDGLEGISASTGTRLWRHDETAWPRAHDDTSMVVEGPVPGMRVLDVATGAERWRTLDSRVVPGPVLRGGVVLTTPETDGTTVSALALADGVEQWRWSSPWEWPQVVAVTDDRVLLAPADGTAGLAAVDLRTGRQLGRSDVSITWWALGVDADTAVIAEPLEPEGWDGGNPAGDPGAVLRGVSTEDAQLVWERPVPAGQVQFGLADGVVLAPSSNLLTAIDTGTGELAWQRPLARGERLAIHGAGGPFEMSTGGALPGVVATLSAFDRVVHGHDPASGAPLWARSLDAAVHDAGVADDVVWVVLDDGFVLLDAATGDELLRVRGAHHWAVALDPLVLFHHESGTVTRLALPEEVDR